MSFDSGHCLHHCHHHCFDFVDRLVTFSDHDDEAHGNDSLGRWQDSGLSYLVTGQWVQLGGTPKICFDITQLVDWIDKTLWN